MIWEPKKILSVTDTPFSLSICHKVMGLDALILVFLMLNFKPISSLSLFTRFWEVSTFNGEVDNTLLEKKETKRQR